MVCLAPQENSAFCLAMAITTKMPFQLLQRFASLMSVVLTASGIIYRIIPYPSDLLNFLFWTAAINS